MTLERQPSSRTGYLIAVALALFHFGMALWFANITPYRQAGRIISARGAPAPDIGAPDERQHVNYVRTLLEGKGFPVFDPKDLHLIEDYQSHQPPLFYLLEAGWAKVLDAADVEDPKAGLRLRSLNCLLGSFDVLLVFCLGFWGFRSVAVGVCAAAVAAALPMNIALSGAVSNDPLLFLLCTGSLALAARSVREGWSLQRALGTGVLIGLALLTKTTALALVPAILFGAFLSAERRPSALGWCAVIAPALLIPALWWARNQSLYGDPLAMEAFNQAFVGSAQARPFLEGFGPVSYFLNWVGWWTVRSFFGAFGYMDIWLNETGLPTASSPNLLYRMLLIGSLAALLGWFLSLKSGRDGPSRAVEIMNAAFTVIVLLLFIKFNLQYFQAQGRYLMPAIGPISCGFAVGTLYWLKDRWLTALGLLLIVFGATAFYAGVRLPLEFDKRTLLVGEQRQIFRQCGFSDTMDSYLRENI